MAMRAFIEPMLIEHFRENVRRRIAEWMLALVMFNWGVLILLPDDSFGQTYRGLATMMTENMWGLLCLSLGGGRLFVLALNGSFRPSPALRCALSIASATFWLLVSALLLQAPMFPAAALAVYPVATIVDVFNALRAAEDAARAMKK